MEHFDDIVVPANRFNIFSDGSDFASIGFTFTYYGEVYDELLVNTNGFVALRDSSQSTTELVGDSFDTPDNGNLELGREGTPDGRGAPIIALYWDDLDVFDGDLVGGVYQQQFPDRYVVQWNKVIFAGEFQDALDAVTFQLVLHKDSNQIEFRYLDVTTTETDSNGNGANATVGLSSGGFDATQLSFNDGRHLRWPARNL